MIDRRTFLIGSVSGLSVLALSACGQPHPRPTISVSPSPSSTAIPQPLAMRRTSWSKDPFARGSFSFTAIGSSPDQRTTLSQPVLDRLFFAGEATVVDGAGTVLGARNSGHRAAQDVSAVAAAGERITVIGAGIAGVTAARVLKDAGYTVVIVEARNRLGGRIDTLTDKAWPFPLELGSSFIHNVASNPLLPDLAGLGVTTVPFSNDTEIRNHNGTLVTASAVGTAAVATAIAWGVQQPQDVSLAKALVGSHASELSKTAGTDGVSDADWLDYRISTEIEIDTGASTDQLSARYGPKPQPDDGIVLGGYLKLITDTAAGLDVLASSVVTRIGYNDTGVSIRLATGESMVADRVVVTVPLGVLKTDAIQFNPPLPVDHSTAISALGMGVLDKVWLQFAKPFWHTNATLWTTIGDNSPFRVWVNMQAVTGKPILMGLVAAKQAVDLARVDDSLFTQAALRSLAPFVGPGAR